MRMLTRLLAPAAPSTRPAGSSDDALARLEAGPDLDACRPRARPAATQRRRAGPSLTTKTPGQAAAPKSALAGTMRRASPRPAPRRAAGDGASRRAKRPERTPVAAGRSALTSKRWVVGSPEGATAGPWPRAGSAGRRQSTATRAPGERRATASSSTVAASSRPPSPSISMSGVPGVTTSPTFAGRAATRPAKGARSAA